MAIEAQFVHTNLIARDWRALVAFYKDVFGCRPVPPERDLAGPWLDEATGLHDTRIRGMHLRLPGCGDAGPTLEIFQYDRQLPPTPSAPHRPGLGHIAFAVEDVSAACDAIVAAGGGMVGEIVAVDIPGAGAIVFAYATDPEGNIIEVQQWIK
jgi:glyoxylase I family protein